MKGVRLFLLMFVFIIFSSYSVYAELGLRPAVVEYNFEPGMSFSDYFTIIAPLDQKVQIYVDGDLAEYVTIDKTEEFGKGGFTVSVKLPNSIEKPGKNRLNVRIKEIPTGDNGFIGALLSVGALIAVNVPYPGKYAEIDSFLVNNANVGEPVDFVVKVSNLGKETIFVSTSVEVFDGDEKIDAFILGSESMETQTEKEFRKTIDKNNFKPGTYNATVTLTYDVGIISVEKEFRIGTSFFDIINWTSEFKPGKINNFDIEIESFWNSMVDYIYAEVNVSKNEGQIDFFKTPSVSLEPWKRTILKGFFNAEGVSSGNYRANITLFYEGKTTEKVVDIMVKEGNLGIVIVAGIMVILGIFIIFFLFKKYGKKKLHKKK